MNNCCICWFFTHILTGDLIFKGLTERRLYMSLSVKGLMTEKESIKSALPMDLSQEYLFF
jgi:hypothetical protein